MRKLLIACVAATLIPLLTFAGSFTVKYDANGGVGTMYAQMFTGDTLKLAPNQFSREGFVFVGWSRHPDEEPCYADQSVVTKKSLSITDPVETGDEQTLYAAWGKEMIGSSSESMIEKLYPDVRFYTGGGDGYWVEDSAVALKSSGSRSWIAAVVKGPGVFSFTAFKSKASEIGCLYAFVGGDIGYEGLCVDTLLSSTSNHGAVELKRSVEIAADGECVLGWGFYNLSKEEVMKLYAVSFAVRVEVFFDAQGGTVYEDSKTYNVGKPYGSLPQAVQRGKTFLGWFTEQGAPISESSIVTKDVVKLVAHWSGDDPGPQSEWEPVTKPDTIIVYARLYDKSAGVYLEDADGILAAFSQGGECRGKATLTDGPSGKLFQLTVGIESSSETGLTLKYWSSSKGVVEIGETFGANSSTIGTIAVPKTFSVGGAVCEFSLAQGWTWVSANAEPADASFATVFRGVSFADDDVIKSSDGSATYYGGTWYPSPVSFAFAAGRAYAVKKTTSGPATVKVSGAAAPASLAVSAGWNWIGPTASAAVPLNALKHSGGFADDDVINSSGGSATYYGGKWYGDLQTLDPGVGYKAKFGKAGTLSFGEAGQNVLAGDATDMIAESASTLAPSWKPVTQPDTIIGYYAVKDAQTLLALETPGSRLGAFSSGGECRGVAEVMQGPKGKLFQITIGIASSSETGLRFKVWDAGSGVTYDVNETIASVSGLETVGSIAAPATLTYGGSSPVPTPTTYTVTFDLGSHGTRIGGGALVQEVESGKAAVAPTVAAASGWTFAGWDRTFSSVTADMTVVAQYAKAGTDVAPSWKPVTQPDTIIGYYTVKDAQTLLALETAGSILGVFSSGGECRGVAEVMQGPRGKLFQITIGIASSSETGFRFKVWDAGSGMTHDVNETIASVSGVETVGSIAAPATLTYGSGLPPAEVVFGPGKVSTFEAFGGAAVVVVAKGLSENSFCDWDYFGAPCFVDDRIVDAEKANGWADDNWWCGQISLMNMFYLTGWSEKFKAKYPTVDDLLDYFRDNPKKIRYATTPGEFWSVEEGTYGYGNTGKNKFLNWYKDTTGTSLATKVKTGRTASGFPQTLKNLLGSGNYVMQLSVGFIWPTVNERWQGVESVSHSVVCCGYVLDPEKAVSDKTALMGLFIIDCDNDQDTGDGGRTAPNSIIYCPAAWDSTAGMYVVDGIWGEMSYLLDEYTALSVADSAKPAPVKAYTLTLKGEATASYADGSCDKTKKGSILQGESVCLSAPDCTFDSKGNMLLFQKWTVSPASVDLGVGFEVGFCETEFTMPDKNVTLTPTYIDETKCGWLTLHADRSEYECLSGLHVLPPENAFEWSPDGKTWYKSGRTALLKAGTYTVQWRSLSAAWAPPSAKTKYKVAAGDWIEDETPVVFSFVPVVEVSCGVYENGAFTFGCPPGGSVSVSPKDGRCLDGKTVSLTAKWDKKKYAFVGWTTQSELDEWGLVSIMFKTAAYKLDRWLAEMCVAEDGQGNPVARFVAVFRPITDYQEEDMNRPIAGVGQRNFYREISYDADQPTVMLEAVVGCALEYSFGGVNVMCLPLTYKTSGSLPKGLKFKDGVLSGTPTKAGEGSFVVKATDPAGHRCDLTVVVKVNPLPSWLAGESRAMMYDVTQSQFAPTDEPSFEIAGGLLELSVTSAGKASAKLQTESGKVSMTPKLEWYPGEAEGDPGTYGLWYEKSSKASYQYLEVSFGEGGSQAYFGKGDATGTQFLSGILVSADTTLSSDESFKRNFCNRYYTVVLTPGEQEVDGFQTPAWLMAPGYLTVKTDKKGVAKVSGKLPDGQAISGSATLLPIDGEFAQLYLFVTPSAYKKTGFYATVLDVCADGSISFERGDWKTPPVMPAVPGVFDADPPGFLSMSADGRLYGSVASLEGYYMTLEADMPESGLSLEYNYKDADKQTQYKYTSAVDLGGLIGSLSLVGKSNGSISVPASKKIWKGSEGYYNYWETKEDKYGNTEPILNPAEASISFAKATGVFSGKFKAYFDYEVPKYGKDGDETWIPQHKAVSVPYAGVVLNDVDETDNFTIPTVGLASGQYTQTLTLQWKDDKGKTKTKTYKKTTAIGVNLTF